MRYITLSTHLTFQTIPIVPSGFPGRHSSSCFFDRNPLLDDFDSCNVRNVVLTAPPIRTVLCSIHIRWNVFKHDIPPPNPNSSNPSKFQHEEEGTLHVETAGATPKYTYKMFLQLGSAGRGARNNKLVWQGYWSYDRLTDDWAEFGMKNYRAFYWSRVKSYGTGLA